MIIIIINMKKICFILTMRNVNGFETSAAATEVASFILTMRNVNLYL